MESLRTQIYELENKQLLGQLQPGNGVKLTIQNIVEGEVTFN